MFDNMEGGWEENLLGDGSGSKEEDRKDIEPGDETKESLKFKECTFQNRMATQVFKRWNFYYFSDKKKPDVYMHKREVKVFEYLF